MREAAKEGEGHALTICASNKGLERPSSSSRRLVAQGGEGSDVGGCGPKVVLG